MYERSIVFKSPDVKSWDGGPTIVNSRVFLSFLGPLCLLIMSSYVLGVDGGTESIRACLFRPDGSLFGSAHSPCVLSSDRTRARTDSLARH